jgi:hypothetical protein
MILLTAVKNEALERESVLARNSVPGDCSFDCPPTARRRLSTRSAPWRPKTSSASSSPRHALSICQVSHRLLPCWLLRSQICRQQAERMLSKDLDQQIAPMMWSMETRLY